MRLSFEQKYWTIHEAAWELTGWPNHGVFEFSSLKKDPDVKKDRPFFHMPISGNIDFKYFGEPFERMFVAIKAAIESYYLKGRFHPLCCGSSYLVSPWDVVVWALRNGLQIRKGVQEVLKVHQDMKKPKDTVRRKIKELTKAQGLIVRNNQHRVDPICKQIRGRGKDTSSLRKYINAELFDKPGKSGRPSDDSDIKSSAHRYLHKVLKDVCEMQADGIMKYQFILLEEVAAIIACEILSTIDRENIRKMDVDIVLEKFGCDPIAKLYLKGAPEIVFHLRRCERICWPRPMIENVNSMEVKIWETTRPWKNQKQRRINFALDNFSYIVVIAETRKGFDLVTAYHLEKSHRREKLRKEFESFSGQKKRAPLF